MFAANYIWKKNDLGREILVMVIRLEPGQEFTDALKEDLSARNRRLPDFKRIGGYYVVAKDFPRTASMKIKRNQLAEELGKALQCSDVNEL